MSLVSFIKKDTDKVEFLTCIEYWKPKNVLIVLIKEYNTVSESDIILWMDTYFKEVEYSFFHIDKKDLSVSNLFRFEKKFDNYSVFSIPFSHHKFFLFFAILLKLKNKIVVNLSEGIIDAMSVTGGMAGWGAGLNLIKRILLIPLYKIFKADYCFFHLFPMRSQFSIETKNINTNYLRIEDHELIRKSQNITTLVVGDEVGNIDMLKNFLQGKNFIQTVKGHNKVIINNKDVFYKGTITAENIIETIKIEQIIGFPSTVQVYGKIKNSKLDCTAIMEKGYNLRRGKYFEYFYSKLCKKLKIKLIYVE